MSSATFDGGSSSAEPYIDALGYVRSIVDTVREPLLVLDSHLRVQSANRSFYRTFRVSPQETEGQLLYDLGNRQWDIPPLTRLGPPPWAHAGNKPQDLPPGRKVLQEFVRSTA